MLSRFSDVLQTAADLLAPPPTRLEDFEYHWKMILSFYQTYDENTKVHVENTRIPHHLHQMLQLIVDEEKEQQGGTVGPCLEAVVQRSICMLDALTALAAADRPPGARALALSTGTAMLRRTRQPCVNSAHVYRPLQRMLIQCNENPASPTEKEEVELLLTLCGLVRQEPGLANIFTTPFVEDKTSLLSIPEDIQKLIPIRSKKATPKKNPLFEVDLPPNPLQSVSIIRTNSRDEYCVSNSSVVDDNASVKSHKTVYDDNDKFLLIDLLLSYLNSADNQVVLRACEGIMIVSSLPEDDIANLVTSCSPACETVIDKLAAKYKCLPANIDPGDVDHLNITWAYVAQDFGDKSYNKFHGYRELTSFFSWLDYCDTLMKECHPTIAAHLSRTFRLQFLEGAAECGVTQPHHAALVTALLSKCLRALDSPHLINEFSNWLVGDGEVPEWPLLHTLIDNCLTEDHDLSLETLKFFESIVEKGTEHSIHRLVLARVVSRGYYAPQQPAEDDERDRLNDVPLWRERERNKEAMKQLQHEDHVNEQITDILSHEGVDTKEEEGGENIHRIINSYLLLLPRAILSDPVGADYDHYIHDAHRHYQLWLDITSSFHWPETWSDNTASSTHSYDSRPEADIHLDELLDKKDIQKRNRELPQNDEEFDEGPFFKMLFKLLANMPAQPYQVNLHLTSIISKLALLPHPNIHEYLLNPLLPTAKKTQTLFKTLQELAKKLTLEIPRLRNYKKLIENIKLQLMSEDPGYDETTDHNQLVESLIVLEEFCKELAAIAFVKYQHSVHMHREAMKQLQHEDHVNEQITDILSHEGVDTKEEEGGENIHRIINSYLLLLPRAILSDPVGADYDHYIHDAHRHYQLWLDITSSFHWPETWSDNTASSTHSYDSRPEADIHLDELLDKKDIQKRNRELPQNDEEFDEGPFFKMLFKLLANMPAQPYQVNLHLTSIISKLALLPHPNIHEYLLNPLLPTAKKTQTLFKTLQELAKKLTLEIPRLRNYKKLIENIKLQLMSEDPGYDETTDHNQLVESLIVLEEFCKELAAIAFVKYQHSVHMHR